MAHWLFGSLIATTWLWKCWNNCSPYTVGGSFVALILIRFVYFSSVILFILVSSSSSHHQSVSSFLASILPSLLPSFRFCLFFCRSPFLNPLLDPFICFFFSGPWDAIILAAALSLTPSCDVFRTPFNPKQGTYCSRKEVSVAAGFRFG